MVDSYDTPYMNDGGHPGPDSDSSKIPHLKLHTPDEKKIEQAKFRLNVNRGAYSEAEYRAYGDVVNDDVEIKNRDGRGGEGKPGKGR